jgi:5-methylcytosine-specific restriction endonuclease McrA
MEQVIILNSDYSFLNVVSWKKAVKLMVKGKAEVVKYSNKMIHNAEKTVEMLIPKVLRIIKLIRCVYKNKVPFSKRNVLVRDGFVCMYCGSEERRLTIDHIIPKSKGGKSNFENCVASCKPCNNKKNDRTPREAGMTLIKQPSVPTIMEFFKIRMKKFGVDDTLRELGVY